MSTIKRVSNKICCPAKCICEGTLKLWRDVTGKNSGVFKLDHPFREEEFHTQSRYLKFQKLQRNIQAEDEPNADRLSMYQYVPDFIVQRAIRIRDARRAPERSETDSDEGNGSASSSNESESDRQVRTGESDYESEDGFSEVSLGSEESEIDTHL